ncbi:MAG: NYN domain-containing protein [Planctomycetes bacterium]|nr:NYN domain-containing protein [Planctomycetota bacterium]
MRTNVYVDGFNLYYRAVKDTPYRWLDIAKLCRKLLPGHTLHRIKYFTARVRGYRSDPGKPTRQQVYLRALETIKGLSIVYGHFRSNKKEMPLVLQEDRKCLKASHALVYKTEEKGSDVNLAVELVCDAFRNDFEAAAIISNDSDLLRATKIVARELRKTIIVLNPSQPQNPDDRSWSQLAKYASKVIDIKPEHLAKSLFPKTLKDKNGEFHKPSTW